MIESRSIAQVQSDYFSALDSVGSNLIIDKKEGSLAYTLSRASSAIAVKQDNRLLDIQAHSSMLTAEKEDLNFLASGIITRESAVRAVGTILAISRSVSFSIPVNTLFIELSSGLQFVTTSNSNIVNSLEFSVPIEAIEVGAANNLSAGTLLFAPNYPDVVAHVGSSHTDDYYGDLIGGRELETDDAFRVRLIQKIMSSNNSESFLESKLLEYDLVDRVFVKTRVPGVAEIWLSSSSIFTTQSKTDILNFIKPYISPGVIPVILQVRQKRINLTIDVRPFSKSINDLSLLSQTLTNAITDYMYGLDIAQPFVINTLISRLSSLANQVTIISPLSDITPNINEVIATGEIRFVFPSNY